MFFEKLVEQHRVHRVVAHGVDFPLVVASHQIRIDLCHLLSHEAELRDARGIEVFLIMEGDRFERVDYFACLVHWLDRVVETLRGPLRTEVTCRTDHLRYASWHSVLVIPG